MKCIYLLIDRYSRVCVSCSDVMFCRVISSGEAIQPWVHSGRIEAITSNILRSPSLLVYLGCVVCVTDKHSDMFACRSQLPYCHHFRTVNIPVLSSFRYCQHSSTVIISILSSFPYCHHSRNVIIHVLLSFPYCHHSRTVIKSRTVIIPLLSSVPYCQIPDCLPSRTIIKAQS